MLDTDTLNALQGVHWQYGYASSADFKRRTCEWQDALSRSRTNQKYAQQQELTPLCEAARVCTVGSLLGGLRPSQQAPQSEAASRYNGHIQSAGSHVVGYRRQALREALGSRPDRYHQIRRSCAGIDWQTEHSGELNKYANEKFDCKKVQENSAPLPDARKSNIYFCHSPALSPCASSSSPEAASERQSLQKAVSEPLLPHAAQNIAKMRLDTERNKGAKYSHVDLTYGQRRTCSNWQTSQAAVSGQNLSEKFDCERQSRQQGVSEAARKTNIHLGSDAEEFADRECWRYGRPQVHMRSIDNASSAFAGTRPVHSHRWIPPPPHL